jgi:hypothetical protein
MALSLKPGFLGYGKNEQDPLFLLCKIYNNNKTVTGYPLSTFEDNYAKNKINPGDEVYIVARAYGSSCPLMGPYQASVINKFIKRLIALEEDGRRGSYDPETYVKNMKSTSNFSGLKSLMDKDNSTVKFQ